jgi:hypothetical protein
MAHGLIERVFIEPIHGIWITGDRFYGYVWQSAVD